MREGDHDCPTGINPTMLWAGSVDFPSFASKLKLRIIDGRGSWHGGVDKSTQFLAHELLGLAS